MEAKDWVPVLAAFGGALMGGAISIIVQWLSSRHQQKIEKLKWREERLRSAIDHQLAEFRALFDFIEGLSDAVSQMRIRQAREHYAEELNIEPHQFVTADKARSDFEEKIWATKKSLMLMDEDTHAWTEKFNKCYHNWYVAVDGKKRIEALQVFEATIEDFRKYTAHRYKVALAERLEQ